jgi:PAS domain S-box-containing protein
MAWTVARGAAIGFGMVLATLIVGGIISFLNTQRVHDHDKSVAHTQEVRAELEGLLSTVKDAETGQRGFIITGDESSLEPYNKANEQLGLRERRLKELIADNPEQLQRLDALQKVVRQRVDVLGRNITLRRDTFDAARQGILEGGGKALMDQIRKQVDEMEAAQQSLLEDRKHVADESYRIAVIVNVLTVVIAAVVIAAAWWLIRREIHGRMEATRLANAQKERLFTTLKSIGDAVIVTDPAGRVTLMNHVAESLTGWGLDAVGKPLEAVFQIVNETTRTTVESPVALVLKKGSIVGLANHTVLIDRHGVERPIDDSGAPIRDDEGKIIGVVLVFRDITERHKSEANQARLNQELIDADRRKDRFLATLAHELRNPLAPISNALELWPALEKNPAEMEKLREMMERQVQQMIRLIDDLLDMSRITRGKIELRKQPVEIATIINGALEAIGPFIQRCDHKLHIDMPPQPLFVDGDVARLLQVLANILHNAAKYSGRNGTIWVEATQQNSEVVVSVRDNGAGIPAEMLEHIFEMFTQVDQTLDRAHGGLGIGLTLAKNLVDLHGGSISAYSAGPGKGSEFTIRLPAIIGPSEKLPTSDDGQKTAASAGSHRVLVVDDVQASAKTLALMLKAIGQEVELRTDGPAALEAAVAYRPDAIFLDIGMPDMDGYEVARRIRQIPELAGVVLVALTGYGQDEDRRRALEAGFNYHVVKPTSLDTLEQLLAGVPTSSTAKLPTA